MAWISKRFGAGENTDRQQDIVGKLLTEGGMTYDVLMVLEVIPGTTEEDVFIWHNNSPVVPRLFPGFTPSEGPKSPHPVFLAGENGVFDRMFPKKG